MRTDESHMLAHAIESKVKEQFPGVSEVITHVEPQ
jgi:divalent metal cation (Fe/Co/Zn/Cd) transporter